MKSINNILMKAKLKNYKKIYKERNKEHELDLNKKQMVVIWTSRTPDMGQTLNSVRAAGQLRTSPLLLYFGLANILLRS